MELYYWLNRAIYFTLVTNILLASLIRDSTVRKIIVESGWEFYYPELSFHEVRKHKNLVLEKSGMNEEDYANLLNHLLRHIILVPEEQIKSNIKGPKEAKNKVDARIEQRILALKQKYPHWGARRLKHQFNLPVHWKTVHNLIKKHGLLIRVKAKLQPCKRFARHHVDSMWQGDTFQFRIKDVGKVYVTGFTDDCSRYRVRSKVYSDKSAGSSVNCIQWSLRNGRVPRQIYLDNGKQFVAKIFKSEAERYGIKLIFGKPYHPRGRGKIEHYHKVLYRELILLKKFKSLSDFRKELGL